MVLNVLTPVPRVIPTANNLLYGLANSFMSIESLSVIWHRSRREVAIKITQLNCMAILFSNLKGDKKLRFFPNGPTWPKILHLKPQLSLFYNKRNFWNISTQKRVWLSVVLQKHQSPIMYLFIFIHSLMSENDKNVLSHEMRKYGQT